MKSGLNKLYSRAIETYKLHQRLPQVDSSVQQLFRCQAPYIYKAPYLSIHRQVHISTKTQDTLSRTYSEDNLQGRKRKGKNSLRRVAVEAQRSRDVKEPEKIQVLQAQSTTKVDIPTNYLHDPANRYS